MKKALLLGLLLACSPALAGEPAVKPKCTEDTQSCLNKLATKLRSSGWIGVFLDRESDDQLYVVKEVVPQSPAEKAGIRAGDFFVAMNGIPLTVDNEEKLYKVRSSLMPGSSITYTIRRDGANRDFTMTLAPMPADMVAKLIGEHMLEHAATDVAQNPPKK